MTELSPRVRCPKQKIVRCIKGATQVRTSIPRRALLWILSAILLAAGGGVAAQQSYRTEIVPILVHSQGINSVAVSPDDSLVATASTDLSIKLWDIGSGRL